MHPPQKTKRRLLTVIMDGVGVNASTFGNAVALAHTPHLDALQALPLATTLKAHGTFVGLPSDQDMGNSEVGHNTIGAGRSFAQGATLVRDAIASGALFASKAWETCLHRSHQGGTLHFLGLLSDGNVHSHEDHLYAMLRQAHQAGVKRIRVHALLDGRDVGEKSAEIYATRLEHHLEDLRAKGCDAQVASGGGRMVLTMDRYNADWDMVARGWQVHVRGQGPLFPSLAAAIAHHRQDPSLTDQYIPGFCIGAQGQATGPMQPGDSVILFNFRGDRAVEISQAFEAETFTAFDRGEPIDLFYAGMMVYDGDLNIPKQPLVSPPRITDTFGEWLATAKIPQFACSETQKYGHVTYFWNGNRSGYFDPAYEDYLEIPSDKAAFELSPWMQAKAITDATIERLLTKSFAYGRINLANGDMVGHTGHLDAAVIAMSTVDLMLGRLMQACAQTDTLLAVTADHGNCDQMFEGKEKDYPNWRSSDSSQRPRPKTSHTLAEVPFCIYDPSASLGGKAICPPGEASLANIANTCLELMGLPPDKAFAASLLQ